MINHENDTHLNLYPRVSGTVNEKMSKSTKQNNKFSCYHILKQDICYFSKGATLEYYIYILYIVHNTNIYII